MVKRDILHFVHHAYISLCMKMETAKSFLQKTDSKTKVISKVKSTASVKKTNKNAEN